MVRSEGALCELCRQHKMTVVIACDIARTLQNLPGAIEDIVAAQVDRRGGGGEICCMST
jgi:hypothetical protein